MQLSEDQYSSLIIQQQRLICYISDIETYELIYLTPSAMELYNLTSAEEYKGKKCYILLQGYDSPCPFCTNCELKKGKKYCWEHHNTHLNVQVDIEDYLIELDGRLCRLEVLRDMTKEVEKIAQISSKLTTEETLLKCVETLSYEKDTLDAVNQFLEIICRFYCADRAYIMEFNLEQNTVSNTFEWCADGVSSEIESLQNIPLEYIHDWIEHFRTMGEFYISSIDKDLQIDANDYNILRRQHIYSLAAIPLIKDDTITGFLGIDNPTCHLNNWSLLRSAITFIVEELEKRRLISELEYASYTDMLTGLKNRNQYIRFLESFDNNTVHSIGIIFIDINGLKSANDRYGHKYGDYIIVQTSKIVQQHINGNIFRIGGDEFIAFCENIDKHVFEQDVLQLRLALDEDSDCDVAIGCIWKDGEFIIQNEVTLADESMYAEKQTYYQSVFKNGRAQRTGIASEVLQEIKDNRFVVHFQPQVELSTGKIIGAEALVRKKHKDNTLISPAGFIPVYEIEGVIRHIDLYVFEMVCIALKKWVNMHWNIHVSVNFSRTTLIEFNIVETMKQICRKYGVPPQFITVEITESISKMGYKNLKTLVYEIDQVGFSISLDDFGSKYSNLSILSVLDFDEIKLDKSLVDEVVMNRKSEIIVKNAIQICHELNHTTVLAEGIETSEQLRLLNEYSCDYGQGFYFSRPIPQKEFETLYLKQSAQ